MEIQEIEGFGISTGQELEELRKALTVGYADPTGQTGGDALRVESLEASLKVLTHAAKHCVMWQKIGKTPAYSTVEEYAQLTSYGSDGGSFTPFGTAPEEDDSAYARAAAYVKFIGTTRKVQHQATLVKLLPGVADIVARENTNGIMKVIKDVEEALFWGNSTLGYSITTTGLEWDGLHKLIDSTQVYDLANKAITEGALENAAEMVADNYGIPSDLFLANKAASAFNETMLPKGRVIYPATGGGLTAGAVVKEVQTAYGLVTLNPSKFLNIGRSPKKTVPASATNAKAPTAPASIAGGAMAGATGQWRAAQQGTFKFQATMCNRYGESAPCALSAGVTVTSSDLTKYIPLTITNGTVVTAPEWINIYATEVDGTATYLIGQVAASSQANGGTTVYNYTGLYMANTSIAFLGELTEDVVVFKQLAPLMKMDLAVIDPSIRWMLLLYGVLQLFAPKKWVRVINIS